MAKRSTPQEMMAGRNPLSRTAVAPVDIYHQPPVEALKEEPKPEAKKVVKSAPKTEKGKATTKTEATTEVDTDQPYSTYLFKRQIKGVKLRAVEDDVNDKDIVQRAIDEYFQNHPL